MPPTETAADTRVEVSVTIPDGEAVEIAVVEDGEPAALPAEVVQAAVQRLVDDNLAVSLGHVRDDPYMQVIVPDDTTITFDGQPVSDVAVVVAAAVRQAIVDAASTLPD